MSNTIETPRLAPEPVDVALRDGGTVRLRAISGEDGPAIHAFFDALSPESIGLRFFGTPNINWVLKWSLDVDYDDRYAIVATTGRSHEIVAHGVFVRLDDRSRAEVAFVVADAWQGHGIATLMLAQLAAAAEARGIDVFYAEVRADNHRMVEVFRESGFPVELRTSAGVIHVELPTSLSPEVVDRFTRREQIAAIAAVRSFLRPASVAVIGASRRAQSVGGALLRNLFAAGFRGPIYPVNKGARLVQGHRSYASIADVPEPIELAVIAVPSAEVNEVARECAAAGVRAVLVISAGFAEVGGDGLARQAELLSICRDARMRVIGPNCLGVINTAADVRLDATFAEKPPPPGRIAFMSQSGGLGIAMIEAANRLQLGLSSFVSVGNKLDISGNDLLRYWQEDDDTDVVLLYLESFGNPRRFSRIAREMSRTKPIVAVKSGRSAAGARATTSHTGAMVSASDVTVDALFRQAGVIRTDTAPELFDVARLLAQQPPPRGNRVAIVSNAGGPGIMCADACQANGLEVVALSDAVRTRLRAFLAPESSTANPIDMLATAPAAHYRRVIELLAQEQACDAVIAIFVPPLVTAVDDVARELHAVAESGPDVTLAAVLMTAEPPTWKSPPEAAQVPVFEFPENAASAIGRAAGYSRWRARPPGTVPELSDSSPDRAASIIATALGTGAGWLTPDDVFGLLECYGLPVISSAVVRGVSAAVAAAAAIDGPVALKAVAPGLVHKRDVGGVRLGLEGPGAVRAAAREMRDALAASGFSLGGFVVQPMAAGVELLVGVVNDEAFGPVIACGAGGTNAELLKDVAVRITPLTDLDAAEMVRSLRTFPLLTGYRGAPPCDVAAVEDVLLRLSTLVETHPEVAELDANPLVASPDGAVIVDARVRIAETHAIRPPFSLDR